ncbi:acyl-CoA/acyl-ACP dehydrogenase [Roseomonas sp. OT10]|uniref:acyl-CoA dehydrogenase family protein n=1 Tax=Roseomonas cutis TaxID=2897332 RepID=UPI001E42F04E|nr:acyl-CoA dehydrogenase family protein [Roseomonas sp. OT10]UFN46899.1 acyl-CoA/acyl-ACP dehydrogenase [Roseomonas sp. OT10]
MALPPLRASRRYRRDMNILASPPPPLARNGDALRLDRLREALPAIAARAAALDAEDGQLPVEDVEALAAAGVLTAPLPAELGGLGWGTEPQGGDAAFAALRLVGRASLPLGRLYEGHMNTLRLVLRHGTAAQRGAAADAARDGMLFGVWNTESPTVSLRIEAGVLRGGKILCSGVGLVERALVTARMDGQGPQQMLLVPLPRGTARADLATWTPAGMRASATGRIDLDGIAVTPAMRLGEPDAYLGQPDFSAGAWRFLAVQLGGLEAVAEALRQHLRRTGRGGDPHQAARLGGVLAAAETARLWVREAARLAEAGREEAVAYVNLARGAVERAALEVMEAATRSVGLQGLMRPNPLERLLRDLGTYLRQPAPDHALVSGAAAGLAREEPVGEMWPERGA